MPKSWVICAGWDERDLVTDSSSEETLCGILFRSFDQEEVRRAASQITAGFLEQGWALEEGMVNGRAITPKDYPELRTAFYEAEGAEQCHPGKILVLRQGGAASAEVKLVRALTLTLVPYNDEGPPITRLPRIYNPLSMFESNSGAVSKSA